MCHHVRNGASSTTRGQTTCVTFLRSWFYCARKGAMPTFAKGRSRDFLSFYISTVAVVSGYFMQHDRQLRKVDAFPFLIILHICCFYACISVVATISTSHFYFNVITLHRLNHCNPSCTLQSTSNPGPFHLPIFSSSSKSSNSIHHLFKRREPPTSFDVPEVLPHDLAIIKRSTFLLIRRVF